MGVVINDFEVLPGPRNAQSRDAKPDAQAEGDAGAKVDPREIETALREIDRRALRVSAH